MGSNLDGQKTIGEENSERRASLWMDCPDCGSIYTNIADGVHKCPDCGWNEVLIE